MRRARNALALVALAVSLIARAHAPEAPRALAFTPPAPGTYRLPPIQAAPDGEVLDESGYFRPLAEFTRGRITLLAFIYTRCADPQGCPRLAWAFREVRAMLKDEPALQARVRLVSLSFDPVNDVPEVLESYASAARGGGRGAEWHFLTTASARRLAPIVEGFGQDLQPIAATQEFTHTLKLFLLDAKGDVREIYSSAYLMPLMIVNDIRTLDAEQKPYSTSATGTQLQKRLRSP